MIGLVLRTPKRLSWLVVPLLVLGACGSEPQDEPTREVSEPEARFADLVAASGERLVDEGPARVETTVSAPMSDAAGGGLVAGTGRGAFDYAEKTGYLTMKMTFSGMPTLGNMTTKTIFDFPYMYMNMSDMLRRFGGAPPQLKPWIRVNLNTIGEQMGIDMGALMRFGQSDASSYALYTQGVEDVERVGRQRVRGEPATHYAATLDFEKLQQDEDIPQDVRSSLAATVELMGTSEIPFEVWLDQSDRMVRQRLEMPMPMGTTGETTPTTIDMTYYAFGREVDVELPPQRQVMDFEELLELGSQPGAYESQGGSDTDGA